MIHRLLLTVVALALSLAMSAGSAWAPTTRTIYAEGSNTSGVEGGTDAHRYNAMHEGTSVDGHTISASYSGSTTSGPMCTLTLDCATEVWEIKINGTTRPCGWQGMFNCGEVVELEAVTDLYGIMLCRWEVNGVGVGGNPAFITMDDDKIVTPVFGAVYPVQCTVAAFPDAPRCEDVVTVDTTITTDPCGNPLTCMIDWGDGSASDCSENTHRYHAPGLYEVTATFTDELWERTRGLCRTTVSVRTGIIHVDCTNTTGVEDGTPEHPYDTIQEGIDAALDGDTVLVRPCTYYENIDFLGRAITVTTTYQVDPSAVETTVIDGGAAGSVVTFASGEGGDSVLRGFTIRNGTGTPIELIPDIGPVESGGGIFCHGSSPTISDNIITGNNTFAAAGILCYQFSSPIISNNVIAGNIADDAGGGILCAGSSSPTIMANAISENSAQQGGAMFCYESSPTMASNTVTANTAELYGGGICWYYSSGAITYNIIAQNTGPDDGGGIWCYQSSPTISHNVITQNTANGHGGGILCHQSSPTISHNVITRNSAVQCGGGIVCGYTEISSPTITTNAISENSAAIGGGIHCAQASSTVSNNTITANTASQYGGGISMCFTSWPTVSNNTIIGNSALEGGGGIWCLAECAPAVSNNIVALNSSGIWQADGTPTLRNNCVYNPDGYDYSGLDPGIGDISADPLLIDSAGGDYHLTAGSPCIDAGWNDAPGLPDTDMDGDARPWPVDGVVDIGADEWVPSPVRFQLTGGCWHLITIPYHPINADPWELFDELREPNKPGDWLTGCLYRYDPAALGYVMYQHSAPEQFGPISPGAGYWLWLYEDETICYEAEASGEPESVHLANAGWHMMGSPHPAHTYLDDSAWYDATTGPYPFSTVSQPGGTLWLQDPLYGWSPSAHGYVPCGLRPGEDDHLRAFKGYWLCTFADDLTVEIPPP